MKYLKKVKCLVLALTLLFGSTNIVNANTSNGTKIDTLKEFDQKMYLVGYEYAEANGLLITSEQYNHYLSMVESSGKQTKSSNEIKDTIDKLVEYEISQEDIFNYKPDMMRL